MARSRTWQMAVIGLGTAVVPLDSAVNIAFPTITSGFDLAIGDIQWVVICYVLTYASLMLALGRIGDLVGHAAIFRIGLLWSAVALVLCALAPSFAALLVCRFLQGIGAALVLSCGAALSTGLYDEARRSRVLGLYTMLMALGATLGPWLGGALVQAWGWPAVFWFRAPIAAAALLLSHGGSAPQRPAVREPFDVVGAGLLALALAALLLAVNRSRDFAAVPLGLIALAAFAGFVRQQARAAAPILDLGVFRLPGFALLNLANVLTNLAGFAVWLLVPYYLARLTDFSLAASGAVLATASIGAVGASLVGGRLIGRIPAHRLALAGAALVGIGLVLVAGWERDTTVFGLVAALTVQGIGLGLFQIAYTDIVTASIPQQNRGVAGSLALVTRTVGIVGAAATVMVLFQSLEAAHGFIVAFQRSFELAALLPFAMVGLLVLRGRR
jgi:MFS family permease